MAIMGGVGIGMGGSIPQSPSKPNITTPQTNQILDIIDETGIGTTKNATPPIMGTIGTGGNYEIAENTADKEQKELWAREDAIRKETQEREDNAYQRSITDMRKAGINPNLQNISGASSGGGIAGATAKNLERIENAKDRELEKALQLIEQNWKGNQNDLDRITGILKSSISAAGK